MRQRAVHRKKTFSIDMRQRRSGSRKTAEERFHMLARGWLAYPVTPAMPIQRKRPSDCSKGRFVRGRLPTLPGYQYHRRGGA